jgi:hypothetical protein
MSSNFFYDDDEEVPDLVDMTSKQREGERIADGMKIIHASEDLEDEDEEEEW